MASPRALARAPGGWYPRFASNPRFFLASIACLPMIDGSSCSLMAPFIFISLPIIRLARAAVDIEAAFGNRAKQVIIVLALPVV